MGFSLAKKKEKKHDSSKTSTTTQECRKNTWWRPEGKMQLAELSSLFSIFDRAHLERKKWPWKSLFCFLPTLVGITKSSKIPKIIIWTDLRFISIKMVTKIIRWRLCIHSFYRFYFIFVQLAFIGTQVHDATNETFLATSKHCVCMWVYGSFHFNLILSRGWVENGHYGTVDLWS